MRPVSDCCSASLMTAGRTAPVCRECGQVCDAADGSEAAA